MDTDTWPRLIRAVEGAMTHARLDMMLIKEAVLASVLTAAAAAASALGSSSMIHHTSSGGTSLHYI